LSQELVAAMASLKRSLTTDVPQNFQWRLQEISKEGAEYLEVWGDKSPSSWRICYVFGGSGNRKIW